MRIKYHVPLINIIQLLTGFDQKQMGQTKTAVWFHPRTELLPEAAG